MRKRLSDQKRKNKSWILVVLILGGLAMFTFNDLGLLKLYSLNKERHAIQINIDEMVIQQDLISEQVWKLQNDPEYIQKIAREKFQMVRPGEKVFKVIDKRQVKK